LLIFRDATFVQRRFLSLEPLLGPLPGLDLTGIHWVIAGGESGPRHRMPDLAWVRDIRDRCVDQHVPFFFKQVGGPSPKGGRSSAGRPRVGRVSRRRRGDGPWP
jgi:protein gp37